MVRSQAALPIAKGIPALGVGGVGQNDGQVVGAESNGE